MARALDQLAQWQGKRATVHFFERDSFRPSQFVLHDRLHLAREVPAVTLDVLEQSMHVRSFPLNFVLTELGLGVPGLMIVDKVVELRAGWWP